MVSDKMKTVDTDITYYQDRFNVLSEVLKKWEQKRRRESKDGELGLRDSAVFTIIKEGVERRLNDIHDTADDEAKCQKYQRLVEEVNTAIHSLMNETLVLNKEENEKRLNAYREYLQGIENTFQNSKDKKELVEPGNIFSIAFDLTKGETMMSTLFQVENESALCTVFLPSDIDVTDTFKYLPMLTHEASHNFRFSKPEERNKFVLDYILECFSRDMIRELFNQIPEAAYNMFLDQDIELLTQEITGVLHDELLKAHPKFLEKAHLDEFPSVIYSLLIDETFLMSEIEGTYVKSDHPRDILKGSFRELLECAGLYLNMKESKLSEENLEILRYFLNDDNDSKNVSADSLVSVLEEITLLLIKKVKTLAKEYSAETFQGKKWEDCVCSLVENVKQFFVSLEEMAGSILPDQMDAYYEIADWMICAKINIENILYICRLYQYIPVKKAGKNLGEKIYQGLQKQVSDILERQSFDKGKAYFSAKKTHSVLVKLGLLDGDEECETFLTYYSTIFKHWDEQWVLQILEENLNVYREIFADLGMCAIFGFNALGYLRFTQKYNPFTINRISRQRNIDRAETVLRVLHAASDKNTKESEIELAQKYLSGDDFFRYEKTMEIVGDYDKRYKKVYFNKMVDSKWAASLRKNSVIQSIGTYYNQKDEDDIDKDALWEAFYNEYAQKYQQKQKRYKEKTCSPIVCMLEMDI